MLSGRSLALWGAWLQIGQVIGLLGTVIAMLSVFSALAAEPGAGSVDALAAQISFALVATAIGSIPALIGTVLLFLALFQNKCRAPWFFNFMVIYAVLLLFGFPIGTIMGIIILTYIIPRKDEFKREQVELVHA